MFLQEQKLSTLEPESFSSPFLTLLVNLEYKPEFITKVLLSSSNQHYKWAFFLIPQIDQSIFKVTASDNDVKFLSYQTPF